MSNDLVKDMWLNMRIYHTISIVYYEHERKKLRETGVVYIKWQGDPKIIMDVLERNGIKNEWNGKKKSAIKIKIS